MSGIWPGVFKDGFLKGGNRSRGSCGDTVSAYVGSSGTTSAAFYGRLDLGPDIAGVDFVVLDMHMTNDAR
jgi:hypothetical protein